MDNFLAELEAITNSYAATESSQITPQQQSQPVTHTKIENQENPENWVNSIAEIQDYQALNQEIESDRTTSRVYIAVGSGLATLGGSACLGNWALEQTYNPTGYMTFAAVVGTGIVCAGLTGTRINGKAIYTSPWLLSSVGASAGLIGGSYAVAKPYFDNLKVVSQAETTIKQEIREIEVKPTTGGFDFSILLPLVGAAAIAMLFLKK